MPVRFMGNDARASHHGLAATAVHSREAGYIYANCSRQQPKTLARRADHTFVRRSFSATLSSMASARSRFSLAFSSSSAFNAWLPKRPSRRTPPSKRRTSAADPVLAANIGGRNTRLLLTQHGNDLLFRKPRSLHGPVLPSVRTLASSGRQPRGHSRCRSPPSLGLLEDCRRRRHAKQRRCCPTTDPAINRCKKPNTQIHRKRLTHPCRPPSPARSLNQILRHIGIPSRFNQLEKRSKPTQLPPKWSMSTQSKSSSNLIIYINTRIHCFRHGSITTFKIQVTKYSRLGWHLHVKLKIFYCDHTRPETLPICSLSRQPNQHFRYLYSENQLDRFQNTLQKAKPLLSYLAQTHLIQQRLAQKRSGL